jgi:hypothetical protein
MGHEMQTPINRLLVLSSRASKLYKIRRICLFAKRDEPLTGTRGIDTLKYWGILEKDMSGWARSDYGCLLSILGICVNVRVLVAFHARLSANRRGGVFIPGEEGLYI